MPSFSDLWSNVKATFRGSAPDPDFRGSMQMWTPGQPIWSEKNYSTFVRNGYRRNPTVYACINKIASAAAGIDWKLYTSRDIENEQTIDEHPMLDLWHKPNPRLPGAASFVEQSFGFWHMSGNNYMWAFRPNPKAPPLALWLMRPDKTKAVAGANGVSGYVYGYETNNPLVLELPDVLHMKFPKYDDDIYGLSPVEVASYMADQQNEALAWNTALMQNAGRPASVFMAKGTLDEETREQIRAEIRRKYSGKRNAGMPLILEADMTWQNMSLTPLELDWLKSWELNTRGIAAIFDVAPELIGDSAGKTFANVAEARQALYLENVLPKLDRMRDYLNGWLVPMYPDLVARGAYFSYDKKDIEALQGLYQAARDAIHARARADYESGIIMLDEARDMISLPPAKYGKVFNYGSVLISESSMKDYADQSLTAPAAPPAPIAEGQQPPALPGGDPNQPALPAPQLADKKTVDDHGVYQPDDLQEQLAVLRKAGVEYVTWKCQKGGCDICQQNDNVTVALGSAFPSGHILSPAHPNCECDVVPAADVPLKIALTPRQISQLIRIAMEREQKRDPIIHEEPIVYPIPHENEPVPVRPVPVSPRETAEETTALQDGDEPTNRQLVKNFFDQYE